MGYNHFAPAKVIGIDSAVKISTGGNYIFALLKDGSIRAWGNNNLPLGAKGVLGTVDNQTTAIPTPVQGISNAVDVVATGGGGAALLADGTLRAWGGGYGPGHRPQDQATNKPVTVEGIRGAIAISPNMVLMPDGSVRDFPSQPSWTTPKLTNAVAIASGGPNRFAASCRRAARRVGSQALVPERNGDAGDTGAGHRASVCGAAQITRYFRQRCASRSCAQRF